MRKSNGKIIRGWVLNGWVRYIAGIKNKSSPVETTGYVMDPGMYEITQRGYNTTNETSPIGQLPVTLAVHRHKGVYIVFAIALYPQISLD